MLYIPTTEERREVVFANINLAKGQLYNLDLNEYLGFQFNPNSFSWEQSLNWAQFTWIGDVRGGNVHFGNLGPNVLDLELVYVADPKAPKVNYDALEPINDGSDVVDFQSIREMIDRWSQLLEGRQRPSRVAVIIGPNTFECIITKKSFTINSFFPDLSAEEAIIELEMREWRPI